MTTGRRRWSAWLAAMRAVVCLVLASVFAPKQPVAAPKDDQAVCDAATEGHRLVMTVEIADVEYGAPDRAGDDWMADRTITSLPMCSYYTPVGSFSLRSYSLDPYKTTERVVLCHGDSAVAPYQGPCPPK